jgi:hypothetical protein
VLERRGHTEAAIDLARLAGLHSSGVICEILKDDGTMARVSDLVHFCKLHELKMITIQDLTQYRLAHDSNGSASRANMATGIRGVRRAQQLELAGIRIKGKAPL